MTADRPTAHHVDAALRPDPARVIARLFLPGEELPGGSSRAGAVVARVLALSGPEVAEIAERLLDEFSDRHRDFAAILTEHAMRVDSHVQQTPPMTLARKLVMGASFTAEFALEGAALCNPSAFMHPDQDDLEPGAARVAVSLRGIGEGHLSSLGFCTAVIGADATWRFEQRVMPAVAGVATMAHWRIDHLRAVLTDDGRVDGLAHSVLDRLPGSFTGLDLEYVLAAAHHDLLTRASGPATADLLRRIVASAYEVAFPDDVELSQQVLFPSTAEESNGIEDARFVRFVAADGTVDYRATYTAYDGSAIAPRLLTSPDLRTFRAQRLAGPAARNKGMALFPRPVGGRHLALCRTDGESNSIASSDDGVVWSEPETIQVPVAPWEVLQVGNCGPPIETDEGWLVLTHGVGPMRTYAIGAILLDLDDPAHVVKRLELPLLQGLPGEQNGYVPNVVYSCGGVVHAGRLWLPYGISDARVGVMWVSVDELLAAMTPVEQLID
ncbi:MAG: hypothetical protein QOH29_711 [Actinomycetota bacterium]|nr:hypothetical protein [Actinomycetota bacterium]